MNRIESTRRSDIEILASQLRSQIISLHGVLDVIEHLNYSCEGEYIQCSIKAVEKELRRLRRAISGRN